MLSSSDGRRGLLSQALQAEPPAETAEDVGQAEDEAASQDTAPQGNTVVSSPTPPPDTLVPAVQLTLTLLVELVWRQQLGDSHGDTATGYR